MTLAFKYGPTSERHLASLKDPQLVEVARLGLLLSPIDLSIVYGYRTRAEQAELVRLGASHTLESAHCDGLAYDWQPAGPDPFPRKGDPPEVVREKLRRFEVGAAAQFEAADRLDYPLQWGNDWDFDGIPTGRDPDERGFLQDLVHLQRAKPHRVAQALARAEERRQARARGERVIS